jgi:3-dehydroquinate synthase
MADLRAPEQFVVQSHAGPYRVSFDDGAFAKLAEARDGRARYIIDRHVAELYPSGIAPLLVSGHSLLVEATEEAKSLDRFTDYVERLVALGTRRSDPLVAIGGGIIQDITCFIAATLFRGLEWHFYPTTLLAQADSCIGSKSSINVGALKNALGTFTPPSEVTVDVSVLETLDERDVRSGVGEMLKVHAIEGPAAFDEIAAHYRRLFDDSATLRHYIFRSLEIKRGKVEEDEFDRGPRNVMNYGHSFGHAIESATDFGVPHGIAVTVGMDLANFVAVRVGRTSVHHFERMHGVLAENYRGFDGTGVPSERFLDAIGKDKKNTEEELRLVLPGMDGRVSIVGCANDERFRRACSDFFSGVGSP